MVTYTSIGHPKDVLRVLGMDPDTPLFYTWFDTRALWDDSQKRGDVWWVRRDGREEDERAIDYWPTGAHGFSVEAGCGLPNQFVHMDACVVRVEKKM